jgi:UDP-2,4-diacetamido-2,4,6-trideoxy-beta-L-altropyranose hydrolase
MNISIRVDASVAIGSGHVMRCLTLAGLLRGDGHSVGFICLTTKGNLIDMILERGYCVRVLKYGGNDTREVSEVFNSDADAEGTCGLLAADGYKTDMMIVDHYSIDYMWESRIAPYSRRIMVIDDLANRRHYCHLLLDQNFLSNADSYKNLVPDFSRILVGTQYVLLKKEFFEFRKSLKPRDGVVKNILVFFGGTDPTHETLKVLDHLEQREYEFSVTVVTGASNAMSQVIQERCVGLPRVEFCCQTSNMADLMLHADLCIGAVGATAWERCCLGLPSLTVVVADNQKKVAMALHDLGATVVLGDFATVTPAVIGTHLDWALSNPAELRRMSDIALTVVGVPSDKNHPVVEAVYAILEEES